MQTERSGFERVYQERIRKCFSFIVQRWSSNDIDCYRKSQGVYVASCNQRYCCLSSAGIPSLGLLPLDPIRVTSLVVDQGVGAVKLKLKFRDLDILNMNSSAIDELT